MLYSYVDYFTSFYLPNSYLNSNCDLLHLVVHMSILSLIPIKIPKKRTKLRFNRLTLIPILLSIYYTLKPLLFWEKKTQPSYSFLHCKLLILLDIGLYHCNNTRFPYIVNSLLTHYCKISPLYLMCSKNHYPLSLHLTHLYYDSFT